MKKLYTLKTLFTVLLLSCFTAAFAVEKTEDVAFSYGKYESGQITWKLGNGITLVQTKGSSSNAVVESNVSAPRIYAGNILSITAAENYSVKEITIVCNDKYLGNTIVVGTSLNGTKVTADNTNITGSYASANGGTHTIKAVPEAGLSQIYLQPGSQLRPSKLTITYTAPAGDVKKITFGLSISTVGVGRTQTIVDDSTSEYSGTLSYKSSDETIATVDKGVITGVKAGSAKITATASAVEGSYGETSTEFDITVVNTNVDLSYGIEIKDFTKIATSYGNTEKWAELGEAGWFYGYEFMQTNTATLQMKANEGYILSPTYNTSDGYEVVVTYTVSTADSPLTDNNYVKCTFDGGEAVTAASPATFKTTAKSAGFRLDAPKSGTISITSIVITPAGATANPVISLADGNYIGTQSVTITCPTEGAKIYYTTDGTEPTASSTEYTGAISIAETTTIKAVAIVGEKASGVASAKITILTPYTSIKAICADSTKTAKTCAVTMDGWLVNAASANIAYIQDGNGDVARINATAHGFVQGDKISGSVVTSQKNYFGILELANITKTTTGVTITQKNATTPIEKKLSEITRADYGKLVVVKDVKMNQTTYKQGDSKIIEGDTEALLYNTFSACAGKSFSTVATYNITGIVIYYNNDLEIAPRTADDIASNLKTPTSSWDKTFETVKVGGKLTAKFTTDSDGTVSYESSNTEVADFDPDEGLQFLKAGKTVITAKTPETDVYVKSEASITVQVLADGQGYVLWVAKEQGVESGKEMASSYKADDNVTISFAKQTATNAPKYYTTGEGTRLYAKNTMGIDVPEGYAVEQIVLTFDGTNNGSLTSNVESYALNDDKNVGTWTGKQLGGVIFTAGATARIKTIEVLYTSNADGASIDNTLMDVIENGAIFDILGRRVEKPGKGIYIINGKKVIIR